MSDTERPQHRVRPRPWRLGFKTSIITLFVGTVLLVGLSLVYLSFARISAMTRTAASTFIDKVAQLGADRIDSQFKTVRDGLEILAGLQAVQSGSIRDNTGLNALMASILRNNPQLFNLYMGYDDGSFLEIDVIDRAGATFRANLKAPEAATFRLFVVVRGDAAQPPIVRFLADDLTVLAEVPGPADYDPRKRPWYADAFKDDGNLLTGPYVFYASGEPGYTLHVPLLHGRRGVVAGDMLLHEASSMLIRQRLGKSGRAFLFDDSDRIVAHGRMAELLKVRTDASTGGLPPIDTLGQPALHKAIRAWRAGGAPQQFFSDETGRDFVAAFQKIQSAGNANIRLAVVSPLDEFYSEIVSERFRLFALAMGFVAAALPIVFSIGSILSRSLRSLAAETDRIQRFELTHRPRIRSVIREVDELASSVHTMRRVVRNFSSFVPKRIVQQLVESDTEPGLGGTRREITVLFTDVADFTAKTEKADPSDVMVFTSRYFAGMSKVIMDHLGTIDKFIGDGIMAFWNAPVEDAEHVRHCCTAVLACLHKNRELNDYFAREGWPAYQTRFGMHVGDAVVGNIGSADRMNYTALGATINLAARLEGLNKNYGTSVLVTDAVKARAESDFVFRSVDRITPKGFAEAFTIYELRHERDPHFGADTAFCRRWEEVYALIHELDLERSAALVASFLRRYPNDGVARYHAERLLESSRGSLVEAPPV